MISNDKLKDLAHIIMGVVLIGMILSRISTIGENKRLKTSIKENLEQIERLESEKIIIFESIKKDSLAIIEKDSIILGLSQKEYSLNNKLKNFKNEKIHVKHAYLRNDVAKRVRIFARLATESDSIR